MSIISTVANSRPSLKALQRYVVPRVAKKWYSVGLELLDDDKGDYLDIIESTDNDCKDRCLKMLKYWIQTHPNAMWNHIIQALESPGVELSTVAAELKRLFTSKQCIYNICVCLLYLYVNMYTELQHISHFIVNTDLYHS